MGRTLTLAQTPTLDTSAYVSGDSLHTAVIAFGDGDSGFVDSGFVETLIVIDKDKQEMAGELWLFNASVTPAAANAAHSISDADAAKCVGVIPFGPYFASALNAMSVAKGVNLAYAVAGNSLYGILVTRGSPTHTAAGLTVLLTVTQD